MVSKSFDIHTANLLPFEPGSKRLLLEISPEMVSVILYDKQQNTPEAVEIFQGPYNDQEDWQSMVDKSRLLSYTGLETQVFYSHPEMIPVPAKLYNPSAAKAQLELFFGSKLTIHSGGDVLEKEGMVVAWQIPSVVNSFLAGHFNIFQARHVVSALISSWQPGEDAEGRVVVYKNMAWMLLWSQGKLQIAKPVVFEEPDDLSWHLLNVCRQYELDPGSVNWKVSGMIEENAPLWKAITRFLDPVTPLSPGVQVPEELPGHYFAHLLETHSN